MTKTNSIIEKKPSIKIKEKVSFEFAFEQSAISVASALMQVGFYTKITRNDNNQYVLSVYTDRITL